MGGCLSQIDKDQRLRPVAYFSKRLSSAQANYPIHNKEMLAIVECLQEWNAELKSVTNPFKIITDHKNLKFFTTKRLLNERQFRYNDVLQQFNFKFIWRAGNACERPDTLSRREQDKPEGLSDERTAGRILQLLPTVSSNNVSLMPTDIDSDNHFPDPATIVLFQDKDLQYLWAQAIKTDKDYLRARDSVITGDKIFPPDIAHKMRLNIADCTVAADGILRGREGRILVPDYETLRTAIIQRIHDSHLAGHPGRDTMIGIILRK